MPFVTCPKCEHEFLASRELIGLRVECAVCGKTFPVESETPRSSPRRKNRAWAINKVWVGAFFVTATLVSIWLVLVIAARVNQRGNTTNTTQTSSSTSADEAAQAVDILSVHTEYSVNQIAADGKYTNKRLRFQSKPYRIGRDRSGRAFVGLESMMGAESGVYLRFTGSHEKDISGLVVDTTDCTFEGTCRGRVADGVSRGVRGSDWHLEIEDCKVLRTGSRKR